MDDTSKPIRVIYFVTTLVRGGGERNLVQYCLNMDPSKFQIEVWCLYKVESAFADRLVANGINIRYLANRNERRSKLIWTVGKALAKSNAELIHVFLPTVAYYAVFAKAVYRMKTPILFSSGGVTMTLLGQKAMFRYGLSRYAYPIICNSQTVKNWWTGIGVDPKLLRVIQNGHDLALYQQPVDTLSIRDQLGVKEDEFLILTVGRLIATKRVCDLIQAMAILKEQFPNRLRLVIAGDGPVRESLSELCESLGVTDRVNFLGVRSDVVSLLKTADLFAFPSESEGLPNAVIEASLAGVPIVGSNIGPVSEVVKHRESALLCDTRSPSELAELIAELIVNPEMAKELADNAKKNAESRFKLEFALVKMTNAYYDAMAGRTVCQARQASKLS